MSSESERNWLKAELAESVNELRRFGWTIETGYQQKTFQEFVHARRHNPRGLDEAMVTVRFDDDGRLLLKKYVLPRGVQEWVECDSGAFSGFLSIGFEGLDKGGHFTRPTHCPCDKKRHRSLIRGGAFARRVAEEAGSNGLQRAYRCIWNPRSVHLSSKKNGEPIPGAYVVLEEGWRDR